MKMKFAKIIKKLGNKKSPGHDNIKSDLIKTVVNEICYPLSILFNLSLSSGTVPNDMKVANLSPFIKKIVPNSLVITGRSPFCRHFRKFLNVLFITDAMISWLNMIFYITSNIALEIIIPLLWLCWILLKMSVKLAIMTN